MSPIACPPPEPIGSGTSYDADLGRARRLLPLIKEGFAATLAEAAIRFALSHPAVGHHPGGYGIAAAVEDALSARKKVRYRQQRSTG